MMWIPRWLGEIYSQLIEKFKLELFTFKQSKELLKISDNKLAVAFSKLRTHRLVLIHERTRPRLYRILNPQAFFAVAAGTIMNLDRIPQERYINLICQCYLELAKKNPITSFVLYGSIARGMATKTSDIDILVVSEDFKGSFGTRIEWLTKLEEKFSEELNWLYDHGIFTNLSYYPLKPEEVLKRPAILLDLIEDAVILWDNNQFLRKTLLILQKKLHAYGAKRVQINSDQWYWDLAPNFKEGETIGPL